MFFEQMHPSWQTALAGQRELLAEIEAKISTDAAVAPALPLVMRAFEQSVDSVRVLIVGQDPYPTPGHAIGLSFAVSPEVSPLPRSLQNMMRELRDDLGRDVSNGGDLQHWAAQGVMLLNRHLTTSSGQSAAHFDAGWSRFTDAAISVLNRARGRKLVAILWGNEAISLQRLLPDVQVISSAHPSPLSARKGFFGSKPFSRTNEALGFVGEEKIDWSC
ncbi:MAG: uracil-DNA glycosylase [Rhodoluna sp.]|nr:uracil-DNA glycosylase [Rhodoluna sp.]